MNLKNFLEKIKILVMCIIYQIENIYINNGLFNFNFFLKKINFILIYIYLITKFFSKTN